MDHLVGTLHLLSTKYPDCGIIMGADKNSMNIGPLLTCGLRLRQLVKLPTINGVILDILITNLFGLYNEPIIAPPINPDDPLKAKPSDHSVPVSWPHTDRCNRPRRTWKHITHRPLPASRLRDFGQWITGQQWRQLSSDLSATEQTSLFENILQDNLDRLCPEQTVKIGSQDKAWVNSELKKIHRQKSREYNKKGKSEKYEKLAKEFKKKYKIAATKYMEKNVEALKELNPGQAYKVLKRMAAQPGDCQDSNTFSLPSHIKDNLTNEECAERIAEHFAAISNTFPPLCLPTFYLGVFRLSCYLTRANHQLLHQRRPGRH